MTYNLGERYRLKVDHGNKVEPQDPHYDVLRFVVAPHLPAGSVGVVVVENQDHDGERHVVLEMDHETHPRRVSYTEAQLAEWFEPAGFEPGSPADPEVQRVTAESEARQQSEIAAAAAGGVA